MDIVLGRIAVGAAVVLGLLQAACSPVGVAAGAGATAGVAAAQDRGISGAIADSDIRVQINHLWLQEDEEMYRKVSLQVQEGRVLVTGVVPSEEMRSDAVRLAWQADGVKEVINEVEVSKGGGIEDFARDTWISAQLKSKLLFDGDVSSINYSVETVNGVIYLLGVAQTQAELDRVLNHARNLAHVRKVVSYVRVKNAAEAGAAPGEGTT
ncbi:BON domain-containing protein [Ferruginivarius sediminum]|nr:BON domain-containing protein [Ferruginivarius sediminum]